MEPPHRLQNAWKLATPETFEALALEIFRYQARHNAIYRRYLEALSVEVEAIRTLDAVPFLPIRFFKDQRVITGEFEPEVIFESSGTTGQIPSQSYVKQVAHYHEVCRSGWQGQFEALDRYHMFALLPSYLERKNASLVSMVDFFLQESGSDLGGFFLDDLEGLVAQVEAARRRADRQIVLWGVSFALLDLAEQLPQQWSDVWVVETGGMKGRRKEVLREELHQILYDRLGVGRVLSEYGMTELTSQAYTLPDGQRFRAPNWMQIRLRETNDPFSAPPPGRVGGINVVDLANLDTCAFIETMDVGKVGEEGVFEVLGRFDHSDVRGCNLMVQ